MSIPESKTRIQFDAKTGEFTLRRGFEMQGKVRTKRQTQILKTLADREDYGAIANYLGSFDAARGEEYRNKLLRGNRPAAAVYQLRREQRNKGTDALAAKAPDSMLAILRDSINPLKSKTPLAVAKGQWVGVEIECYMPYELLFSEAGLDNAYEDHMHDSDECDEEYVQDKARTALNRLLANARIPNVQAKHDGSISPEASDMYAVELTIFFRIGKKRALAKLCKLLKRLDAQVNKSCGLHVHLDCRDLGSPQDNPTSVLVADRGARLTRALPVLLQMVPRTRRENTYCRPRMSGWSDDRYCAINLTAWEKYSTIEVRLHSGTTSFKKIARWADMLYRISRADIPYSAYSADELISMAKLSPRIAKYIKHRMRIFAHHSSLRAHGDGEDANVARVSRAAAF